MAIEPLEGTLDVHPVQRIVGRIVVAVCGSSEEHVGDGPQDAKRQELREVRGELLVAHGTEAEHTVLAGEG